MGQKWWNNQKASELAMDFLPAILCATNTMAEYIGQQLPTVNLQLSFTRYCRFELMDTALNSLFCTMRSGSNEVFLRTAFQYSKSNLRKLLISFFENHEIKNFDVKQRKKKDLWLQLVKQKKQGLFAVFNEKKMAAAQNKIGFQQSSPISTSTSIASALSLPCDSSSCTTAECVIPAIPSIDWQESVKPSSYVRYRAIDLSAPYHDVNRNHNININNVQYGNALYGNHRQCSDCNLYLHKVNELITTNSRLLQENAYLKQVNQQFLSNSSVQWNGERTTAQ